MGRLISTLCLCLVFGSAQGWAQKKDAKAPAPKTEKKAAPKADKKAEKKAAVEPKAKAPKAKAAQAKPAEAGNQYVEVLDLQMAQALKDRNPEEASKIFDAGSRAFTWVKLKVKQPETAIKLRYSIDGRVSWTSNPLTVKKSPHWRTWLRKKLHRAGQWKVEVLDAEDNPVHSLSFTVK